MRKYIWIFIGCFCVNSAFGYVTENISNGCIGKLNATAMFQVNTYQCASGFYLPANAVSCEACPSLYTCPGGSFPFNEEKSQGLRVDGIISNDIANGCGLYGTRLTAKFAVNTYTCDVGYYLPANEISCTKCLNDNYCPGGKYTFNESKDQGIISCPQEHPFAPVGMWQLNQCGRILHIGNEIMYMHQSPANSTPHRLFVKLGKYTYSVNTTQKIGDIILPNISRGVLHKLYLIKDGIEYVAHDDSAETE